MNQCKMFVFYSGNEYENVQNDSILFRPYFLTLYSLDRFENMLFFNLYDSSASIKHK